MVDVSTADRMRRAMGGVAAELVELHPLPSVEFVAVEADAVLVGDESPQREDRSSGGSSSFAGETRRDRATDEASFPLTTRRPVRGFDLEVVVNQPRVPTAPLNGYQASGQTKTNRLRY